jgi:RNA polymerase sigma-70 factor, ECF subfamily
MFEGPEAFSSPRVAGMPSSVFRVAGGLAAGVARARERWPELALDEVAFVEYATARLSPAALVAAGVLERIAEVYLAFGCSTGDARAILAFERTYFGEVDAVAARLEAKGIRQDDLRQHVRERLFLGSAEAPPKIASYSGEGELRHWVRVVAMRAVLNLTRGPSPEQSDEAALLLLPDLADDPELGFMKRHYLAEFDAAVADAHASLSDRERIILKLAMVDRLPSHAIGAIYGVHRTTAKRWLEDAEKALMSAIRKSLMERLQVTRAELQSILRLVQSRLELRLAERGETAEAG